MRLWSLSTNEEPAQLHGKIEILLESLRLQIHQLVNPWFHRGRMIIILSSILFLFAFFLILSMHQCTPCSSPISITFFENLDNVWSILAYSFAEMIRWYSTKNVTLFCTCLMPIKSLIYLFYPKYWREHPLQVIIEITLGK